eukprot:SAG11_NODE_14828_length_598_cov_1.124248_2_plen_40_part_01
MHRNCNVKVTYRYFTITHATRRPDLKSQPQPGNFLEVTAV